MPSARRGISGRRAIPLLFGVMALLIGLVMLYVFTSEWRQRPRLVADGLRQPRGVVWMPDDALVVAEGAAGAGRLTWASAESTRATLVDGLPGATGVARHPDGRLLVLAGRALLAPDASGRLAVLADLGTLVEPWGLAVAGDGTAYVSDAAAGVVVRVREGSLEPIASLGATAAPRGLTLAPDGRLHVALSGHGTIVTIEPATILASQLAEPVALAFDPQARLLVLERGAGRLIRLPGKEVLAEGLDQPTAIATAPDGRVYVTTRGFTGDRPGQLLQIRRLGPLSPRRVV